MKELYCQTEEVSKESLIDTLILLTSNNDTSGENGEEYLWDDAKKWFASSTITRDKDAELCDDLYLYEKYKAMQDEGAEAEIIISSFFKERYDHDYDTEYDYDLLYINKKLSGIALATVISY